MIEQDKMILFNIIAIIITFIILGLFTFWMARKSWEVYDSLYKIEKRVSLSQSILELQECINEIENLNLFHPSHHQEAKKITAIIKTKMQYLN